MAYAVFNGEPYYHLIKASSHRMRCGLRTVNREGPQGEHLPPASVTNTQPRLDLFSPCPRREAEQEGGADAAEREVGQSLTARVPALSVFSLALE